MPEITAIHVALLALLTVIGAVAGWVSRGNRSEQEKAAVSAGWQEQMEAQRKEHARLLEQNKSLMEQVSQYQASNVDAKNRARELSAALQEAFGRRDELQREIKSVRSSLEMSLNERDRLQSDVASRGTDDDLLRQKDERIDTLTRELENWQNRLPPLIERFRVRNAEAERFEAELVEARERVRELELETRPAEPEENETRIEPVHDPEELTDGLDASNDPDEIAIDELMTTVDEVVSEEDLPEVDSKPEPEPEPEPETRLEEEPESGPEPDFPPQPGLQDVTEADSFDDRDDLQQIKGVGPAIEKTLNELGIFRFEQIADMSEYDIDRVARKLKGFHSRIYREDWIGQARELLGQAARA